MKPQKWTFFAGILVLALLAGLLGGFNMHWSRMATFPVYGLVFDLIAVPACIVLLFFMRRLKSATTDEFQVAKKRFAAQTGLLWGFALFAISGAFPIFFPGLYHQYINSLDGADDGFIMGRVAGMLPFFIGIVAGQFAAWAKYR